MLNEILVIYYLIKNYLENIKEIEKEVINTFHKNYFPDYLIYSSSDYANSDNFNNCMIIVSILVLF